MAITIENKPTTPNVTDTKLVYAVSSSLATNPQFQYVTDIYVDGSSERLTRIFSYPNPQGYGVLEVGSILGDNLEYDNDWKVSTVAVSDANFKSFTLAFSESYASSISGSTTVYAGGANDTIKVFSGTVPQTQGSYNFLTSASFQVLSNSTKSYISKGNHITVPIYTPEGSYLVETEFLDASGTQLDAATQLLASVSTDSVFQVPIASGSTLFSSSYNNDDWEEIKINYNGDTYYTLNRVRECDDSGVTFAFINNYGYYEYYSIKNPVRKSTDVERDIADLPQVDYSNVGLYDITRRGEKAYNTSYTDEFEVTTDYIDEETSTLLTELFDSPEAFIQEQGDFIPIVITNATYERNTNQNRQKLFQYTINYRYSNQRYSR